MALCIQLLCVYIYVVDVSFCIFSMNKLYNLPRGFGACPQIEMLDCTYNNLSEHGLPSNFFCLGLVPFTYLSTVTCPFCYRYISLSALLLYCVIFCLCYKHGLFMSDKNLVFMSNKHFYYKCLNAMLFVICNFFC